MRGYPVPLELRNEEKIIGGYLSGRQLVYLLAAAVPSYLMFNFLPDLAVELWGHKVGRMLGWGIAGLFGFLIWMVALALAFLPAGLLFLPGPRYQFNSDPYDLPIRLDQWLILQQRFRQKPKILPYRRYFE